LQSGVGNQVNTGGFDTASAKDTLGNMTSGITGDIMNKELGFLQPFFTTSRDQLDTKLKNQGLSPSDPAYANAMRELDTSQNLSVQDFLAKTYPTAFNMAQATYMTPLQVAQQEMGLIDPKYLTGGLINPPQGKVSPADYTSAQANYQNALNTQYGQQVQQQSNMMSGLFGIPTALLGGWAQAGGMAPLMAAV
jgi:hypothetical protein